MEHITVEELNPGVILEVTKPNGVTYQYKTPEGSQEHKLEIEIFKVERKD